MYAADGQAGAPLGAGGTAFGGTAFGGTAFGGTAFGGVAEALRAGDAFADFLNSPAAAELDGPACGEALTALGEIQGKLSAAYAALLRRLDVAGAHHADGYGSTSAWLAAKGQLTKKDARTAVREMRRLGERPRLDAALAAGSVDNLVLVCQFHHDVCIHRHGWRLLLHPDGTTEARSPNGKQILYSHAPPAEKAA